MYIEQELRDYYEPDLNRDGGAYGYESEYVCTDPLTQIPVLVQVNYSNMEEISERLMKITQLGELFDNEQLLYQDYVDDEKEIYVSIDHGSDGGVDGQWAFFVSCSYYPTNEAKQRFYTGRPIVHITIPLPEEQVNEMSYYAAGWNVMMGVLSNRLYEER